MAQLPRPLGILLVTAFTVGTLAVATPALRTAMPQAGTGVELPDAEDVAPTERVPGGLDLARIPFEQRFPPRVSCQHREGDCVTWSYTHPRQRLDEWFPVVVVPERRLLVTAQPGRLLALDVDDGDVIWETEREPSTSGGIDHYTTLTAVAREDLLLVLQDHQGDELKAYDLSTGAPRWAARTSAGWFGHAWSDGKVLRVLHEPHDAEDRRPGMILRSFDLRTGEPVGAPERVVSAAGDDRSEVRYDGGIVRLFDHGDPVARWEVELAAVTEDPDQLPEDEREDWAWVGLEDDEVLVDRHARSIRLDRRSGVERDHAPSSSDLTGVQMLGHFEDGRKLESGRRADGVFVLRVLEGGEVVHEFASDRHGWVSERWGISLAGDHLLVPRPEGPHLDVIDLQDPGMTRTYRGFAQDTYWDPLPGGTMVLASSEQRTKALRIADGAVVWEAATSVWPLDEHGELFTWPGGFLRIEPPPVPVVPQRGTRS